MVFVINMLIGLALPGAVALGPYRTDTQLTEESKQVVLFYTAFSIFCIWPLFFVNWPYSSRTIVGIRNFTLIHEFLYAILLSALLLEYSGLMVPKLSDKYAVGFFTLCLDLYRVAFSAFYWMCFTVCLNSENRNCVVVCCKYLISHGIMWLA